MKHAKRSSELGPLLAGVYDNLAEIEKRMHEMKLMSVALVDTLGNFHPDAQAIYQMAYQHHSQATAELHLKAITELKGLADSLRAGW
jgi:flagellar biosynthesis GTPase FlhF